MKNWSKTLLKDQDQYYRLFYTIFSFFNLAYVIWYLLKLPSPYLFNPGLITRIPGGLIALMGITVMAICIKKYFSRLSGIRSLYMVEKSGNELMVTGIHKYLRHPLYSGTFLFIWGLWMFYPFLSLLITNLVITIYTVLGISWEEQKLEAEFGDSYKKYKLQVPKLIPSLGSKRGREKSRASEKGAF